MKARILSTGLVVTLSAALAFPCMMHESLAAPTNDAGVRDAGAPSDRETLDEPKLASVIAQIADARKKVSSLRANFTQERSMTLLATRVTSKGELTFVAPDKLRWELFAPDDVVYWIGPEGLSFRTRSSRATTKQADPKITRGLSDLRALLGGDLNALRERYALRGSRGAADVEIAGSANDPKATITGFSLVLDKDLVTPKRARLLEGKSDAIDIVFSNGTVNAPVDPKIMHP